MDMGLDVLGPTKNRNQGKYTLKQAPQGWDKLSPKSKENTHWNEP
jgi:hypothetical protein